MGCTHPVAVGNGRWRTVWCHYDGTCESAGTDPCAPSRLPTTSWNHSGPEWTGRRRPGTPRPSGSRWDVDNVPYSPGRSAVGLTTAERSVLRRLNGCARALSNPSHNLTNRHIKDEYRQWYRCIWHTTGSTACLRATEIFQYFQKLSTGLRLLAISASLATAGAGEVLNTTRGLYEAYSFKFHRYSEPVACGRTAVLVVLWYQKLPWNSQKMGSRYRDPTLLLVRPMTSMRCGLIGIRANGSYRSALCGCPCWTRWRTTAAAEQLACIPLLYATAAGIRHEANTGHAK